MGLGLRFVFGEEFGSVNGLRVIFAQDLAAASKGPAKQFRAVFDLTVFA